MIVEHARAYTVRALTKFFLRQTIFRVESWIVCTLSLLSYAVHMINAFRSIERNTFLVSGNLFEIPVFTSAVLVSLLTSILLLMHVTKDFNSGVYESYLYGPVDEIAYIQSVFLTYAAVNLLAVVLFPLLWIVGVSLLVGLPISSATVILVLAAYLLANSTLLIALFIGSAARRSRSALWYTLLFHGFTIGLLLADLVVSRFLIPVKRTDVDLFSFFRNTFHALFEISVYFSPYTQLYLLQQHYHHSPQAIFLYLPAIVLVHFVFYFLAVTILRRRV